MLTAIQHKLATMNEKGEISQRQPALAVLFSICPGLGQQYAGYLFRGITAYASLIIISWLAAMGFMYTPSFLGLLLLSIPFIGVAVIAADAYHCAAKQTAGYMRQWFNLPWVYAGTFLTLLLTVNPLMDFLVGERVVRAFFVTSASMTPTVLEHDVLLINKLAPPKKGDIVLIDFTKNEALNRATEIIREGQLIRRIIAEPGDSVEIIGQQLLVNGEAFSEPYATFGTGSSHDMFSATDYHFGPKVVPAESFFVLSDARNFGLDSRILGFIKNSEIEGVATKVFWSWNLDEGNFKWERTTMSLDME